MNCQDYEAALGDLIDGAPDAGAAAALHAHLSDCERCRALTEDFRAIRSAAQTLERHLPPARTWQRIAAAVVGEGENLAPGTWTEAGRRSGGFTWVSWRSLAAAAVILLMLSATWLMLRPAAPSGSATTAEVTADPSSIEFDMQRTEADYEMAIAGLERITVAGGIELDPMTADVLRVNLTVIDMAIGESRAALQTEPSNDVAQQTLLAALGSKIAMLQDTVALINEMRQDNPEAAASGLNQ